MAILYIASDHRMCSFWEREFFYYTSHGYFFSHYLDAHAEGDGDETREQRIIEYIPANPGQYEVGLREGCLLFVDDVGTRLVVDKMMRIFKYGEAPREVQPGELLDFLYQ